jgi:hypothetical protein
VPTIVLIILGVLTVAGAVGMVAAAVFAAFHLVPGKRVGREHICNDLTDIPDS